MHYKILLALVLIFIQFSESIAQDEVIQVWPDSIPGAISNSEYQEIQKTNNGTLTGVSKVTDPSLSVFKPENPNGTSIIVFPGGGYSHLAIDKEGFKVAKWLNSLGVTAFVLKYRLPSDQIMDNKENGPLQDAQESVRIIRRNAKKWNLQKDKIGIIGFSAGGHLASTLATKYDDQVYKSDATSARPDFSAFIYPVVTLKEKGTHRGSRDNLLGKTADYELVKEYSNELNVDSKTPPAFLIHATDDQAVPVENSINYYLATKAAGVPAELHLYEKGGHGFGLGRGLPANQWPETFKKWLQSHKLLEKDSAYVFSYFKGNGEDGLHLAYSENGLDWKALNKDKSYLKPELGNEKLMRDPCIIKGGDGKYHMVWTVGWTEKGIGYASSEDLIHWSSQKFIPVMEHEDKARNCWAPEITYDPHEDHYIIYWATTIEGRFPETQSEADNRYNHRMYYTITKDFENFTPTKLFYDPGFNIIDATIKEKNEQYYMFLKNETRNPPQKNIRIATADKLIGPYHNVSEPITGKYWAEGPTVTQIEDYWYVYFDKYIEKEFGAVRSENLEDWEDVSEKISFPEGTRHGTVFQISSQELKGLNENSPNENID